MKEKQQQMTAEAMLAAYQGAVLAEATSDQEMLVKAQCQLLTKANKAQNPQKYYSSTADKAKDVKSKWFE